MKTIFMLLFSTIFCFFFEANSQTTGVFRIGDDQFSSLVSATGGIGNDGTNAGTGNGNLLLGHGTGANLTNGHWNNFLGYLSGTNNTSGKDNNFLGYLAGRRNTTGSYNNFLGTGAGHDNTTGGHNVFIGYQTGNKNRTGMENVCIGTHAGYQNTTGDRNVHLGYKAGAYSGSGDRNVFIGNNAGAYAPAGNDKLYIDNSSTSTPLLYGDFASDQLGINTNSIPTGYTFAVVGKIVAEEIKVQVASAWPDYVFHPAYKLPSLKEVEKHIKTKGQLTNIPSAKEVEENGIELGEMNAKLLQKIEELTLYILALNKRMEQLEKKAH